jgi:uncharacterized protein YaaQ
MLKRPTFSILAQACADTSGFNRKLSTAFMMGVAEGNSSKWDDAAINSARASVAQALTGVGIVSTNENGAGKKPVSATESIIKAMTKLIKEKKPSKAERVAILAQMAELLK